MGNPTRRRAPASQSALSATSWACSGSAEIDGIRSQASRSACRSSRWAETYSRSGLLVTAPTVVPRAVLLLHGFPETSASWAAVTPLLTQAGLRTYAPDQLGYSPGARPGEVEAYSAQNLAQVTADLMTALAIPVADVVGHDWGANVAWTLAAWHP